jgi:two-component system alkaline phosphatase synthesis response regulator PhoP
MKSDTILVIEDDKSVREGLVMNLQLQGYQVLYAEDGDKGMTMAFDERPDLLILDIMMPGWNGLEILAELREQAQDVPVLLLSARDKTADKIEGLEIGADDYMAKPFELPELLARVEALLRRHKGFGKSGDVIAFGDVEIDETKRTVRVRKLPVELSMKEFDLLLMLAKSPGRPFERDSILSTVWGWDFDGTVRTVDNFIRSLRQKIEADPSRPVHILTVRQVGYKLEM